jgi:hypothetical protein
VKEFVAVHVELGPIVPISSDSGELSRVAASDPLPAGLFTNAETEPIIERTLPDFDSTHEFDFRDDIRDLWPRLRDDVGGLANWNNAGILGVALAGSLAMRSEFDNDVRDFVAKHPKRWDEGSEVLGWLGDATVQVPVLLGVYAYSVHRQDEETHDLMSTLLSAYMLNGAATLTVKAIANTDRPSEEWNGGKFGFPSFHTSSSFTIAAVLDEYEGHHIGLPAYALAGLIGWSRIDEQDHDLSDVVFGAAMGYVIGKSVAGRHLDGDSRVRILPYTHPTDGSSGVMLDIAY